MEKLRPTEGQCLVQGHRDYILLVSAVALAIFPAQPQSNNRAGPLGRQTGLGSPGLRGWRGGGVEESINRSKRALLVYSINPGRAMKVVLLSSSFYR